MGNKLHKQVIKITLFCLTLIPVIGYGQVSQDGLWKGYPVQDLEGNEIRYKRQDFIKVKESSILIFQFQELMSMETGEVIIETVIDTLNIEPTKSKLTYNLLDKDKHLKLEMKGNNEFQIIYPEFVLTFKKIINLRESNNSLKEYEDFIIGNTLVRADPTTNTVIGKYSKTYLENGMAKYNKIGSKSKWESPFKIVEFEGFVFLKGITSATIILNGIDNHILNALEADYRSDIQEVSFGKPNDLLNKDKPLSKDQLNVEKPFVIELPNKTNEQCISELPNSLLNLEVGIAKGITEKQINTVQVQHSYDCSWMLFHEEKFDGFAKTTIKKLISIDSSLCHIFQIPCGYYAERESKDDAWFTYLHEDRIETDSSYIIKKAFKWDNTYRVINEVKDKDLIHYQDYYLDSRILKKTWSYLNGKEFGVTRLYDKNGKLEKEIHN